MYIDQARYDDLAGGIHRFCSFQTVADRSNSSVANGEICNAVYSLRGVYDSAIANDKVVSCSADQRRKERGTEETAAIHGQHYIGDHEPIGFDCTARTGKPIWETRVSYTQDGHYLTMAPRIADGKVIVGVSGGDKGENRGYFDAPLPSLAWVPGANAPNAVPRPAN
jgi:outer membrane protein assembly factor BamB